MDLGIDGKQAVVCASSKGLGLGCAEALAAAGCNLVMNGRGSEALELSAQTIRSEYGVSVVTVAADVSTIDGQNKLIEAAGDIDILVNNAGGPPPGIWTDWDRDDFIKAIDANMLAPINLMKAFVPGMMQRGWGARGQYHFSVCKSTNSRSWFIEFGAYWFDRLCCRHFQTGS